MAVEYPPPTGISNNPSSASKSGWAVVSDEEKSGGGLGRRFVLFQAVPAWIISLLVHAILLVLMGVLTIGVPEQLVNILSASNSEENEGEIEEFTLAEVDPGEISEVEEVSLDEPAPTAVPMTEVEPMEITEPVLISDTGPQVIDMVSVVAPSQSLSQSLSQVSGTGLSSRGDSMKKELLKRYGGTAASEAAVAKALRWLAIHQIPNGGWTFNHHVVCRGMGGCDGMCDPSRATAVNAATALGVLPFLGAGQTHMDGVHKENVRAALTFLIRNGKPRMYAGLPCLDFSEAGGNMYSHGLVAIALCEAYAMTGDPVLAGPAQQALNFTIYAQDPRTGGWRYGAHQAGDTSVTGWHVMALKSGHMAHLIVPPASVVGINNFLNLVAAEEGASYKYTYESGSTGAGTPCQPIGLLCRMYMGWDKSHPAIIAGAKQLGERGVMKNDIYYNYYAAQVLRHYGGPEWDKFNTELRDWLVSTQVTSGHPEGSWHFADSVPHRGPNEGGRLLSTAIATMILEVYYRHMPLYADSAAEDEFPL